MDAQGRTVWKSVAALRKEVLEEIKSEQGKISAIRNTLGILGDKNVFDPAVGANTKNTKVIRFRN